MAKGEWPTVTALIKEAPAILVEQQPMTVRQLSYRMIGIGPLVNDQASCRKVSRMMVKARRDRRIPYGWIADRTRPVYEPNVWKDPQAYGEGIKRGYRRDYWQWQPFHVEIWSEKDTVVGSIEDVAYMLGVTIRVGRGFTALTRLPRSWPIRASPMSFSFWAITTQAASRLSGTYKTAFSRRAAVPSSFGAWRFSRPTLRRSTCRRNG